MEKRPPIIAIMGHVDHGKTTLLDHIRKTSVASREAGGITQSIGAYEIEHNGRGITFIDTPGHEAFANMRAHSAKIADLAILVVAADDGVKPQTVNALHFITEEKIPYVVAVNKVDKPNADIAKTKQSLMNAGVYLEGMGGNISFHEISAKTGEGVSELLDLVLLLSDTENIVADPHATPSGIVLTAKLDPRRGIIVGAIVKNGTLRQGELIATETAKGKIKMLSNFLGKSEKSLGPGSPVLIGGFESLPSVGEEFFAGEAAFEFCLASRDPAQRDKDSDKVRDARGVDIPDNAVPVILKADESGSLEALRALVCNEKNAIHIVVLSATVGDIYENDIKLARSAGAVILGFKSKFDKAAQNIAKNEKVTTIVSNIIYELDEAFKKVLKSGIVVPQRVMEILRIFGEPKGKEYVVGVRIAKGVIQNQETFEVWRDKTPLGEGKILNLQANRADVKEVAEGQEAGLLVESSVPLKPGISLVFPVK